MTGILEGEGKIGVLLAHGAGTDQNHPAIAGIRRGLAAGGLSVMSFNYPYKERGSQEPGSSAEAAGVPPGGGRCARRSSR